MQSWSLEKFVNEFSEMEAARVWNVSQQAVNMARKGGRDIRIVLIDGFYEIRESKILRRINKRFV